jgi:hypothetical protein
MSRGVHRLAAERHARAVLAEAEARGATGREKRRMLRARFATLSISEGVWYQAAVRVAGCPLLELRDARQPELIERGPRKRRVRRARGAVVRQRAGEERGR